MVTQDDTTGIPGTFKCQGGAPGTSSRNLVVCIDGTSNQFGTKNTNIVEFYSHIRKNDCQLTYYSSGVGTTAEVAGPSLRHRLSNNLDMAIGRNLHKAIIASYRWLSNNYQDGDRIFLFGYSRGAYQVRALAGMISRVGLLLPGNDEEIPFAFELYSKTDDDDLSLTRTTASVFTLPGTKESKENVKYSELAEIFQRTFCRDHVHIHFVGVWDTVSSIGIGRSKTFPLTTTSCEHVCYFRHALALDERRVGFLPEYVYGGRSSYSDDDRIKEVWFPGAHSDIGGGNRHNETLQSGDIPLLWMRSQAIAAELMMEPAPVIWKIDDLNKQITPSLKFEWWPLELLPLKRLLYFNSDRQTSRPHLGGPRRILPGQKVHVSALFKDNYKPYAQFYNDSKTWPEPMFWNDAQRLESLSDSWEKDIFDKSSVQTLLDDLQHYEPELDALDRLAFMASFEVCKLAIRDSEDARRILTVILNNKNRPIRLSGAVTYCELGWARNWRLETTQVELGQQIAEDISELLNDEQDRRRACIYLPSLCKWTDLRPRLITKENLKMLVKLCDNTRVNVEHEEGHPTIAFHSAQALSMLVKLDADVAQRLIDIEAVTDITEALRSNCGPVLASVLSVLNGLAKHKYGRAAMKSGPTVATVLMLSKHSDDFVASAAIHVLCSLLPEDDLREIMHQFGVLSIFRNMLDQRCNEMKEAACQALVNFAQYEDIQRVLFQQGFLQTLAKRVQSHDPSMRDGAISALVNLGRTQEDSKSSALRTAVTEAINATNAIPVLITRLKQKSTALPAASVLARLVKIDDVAVMVSDDKSGACSGILSMLRRRWFDRLRQEDGLQILTDLLECDPLQSTMLTAAIDVLSEMINPACHESTYAGLHYLRIVARFDSGHVSLPRRALSLVPRVVSALHVPHRRVQRIAMETLQFLSAEGTVGLEDSTEDLRNPIVECLLGLLSDRQAHVLFAASTLLSSLAANGSMRDRIVTEKLFLDLRSEYHKGLKLVYDKNARGPRADEVHRSIGRMIKLVQDMGVTSTGDSSAGQQSR